jgi:hypothetical protein
MRNHSCLYEDPLLGELKIDPTGSTNLLQVHLLLEYSPHWLVLQVRLLLEYLPHWQGRLQLEDLRNQILFEGNQP